MIPIEFDIYIKIIGSIGLLSILSQVTSFFKLLDEIKRVKLEIINKKKSDDFTHLPIEFHPNIESDIFKVDNIKAYFFHFMTIVALSVISTICYAIFKDIPYLFNAEWYSFAIAIISYVFIFGIPIYFLITIFNFFNLYYRIIHYNTLTNIYNYTP